MARASVNAWAIKASASEQVYKVVVVPSEQMPTKIKLKK